MVIVALPPPLFPHDPRTDSLLHPPFHVIPGMLHVLQPVCLCVCVVLCRVCRRAYVFANLGFFSHLAYRLLTSKYLDFLAVADLCQYEKVRVVDIYIYIYNIDLSLLPPCWPILCQTPAHLNPPPLRLSSRCSFSSSS